MTCDIDTVQNGVSLSYICKTGCSQRGVLGGAKRVCFGPPTLHNGVFAVHKFAREEEEQFFWLQGMSTS